MPDNDTPFPSRANIRIYKGRLASADKGLSIMKRKCNALEMKIRSLSQDLDMKDRTLQMLMSNGIMEITKAQIAGTGLTHLLIAPPGKPTAKVALGETSSGGVTATTLFPDIRNNPDVNMLGLGRGGTYVKEAKEIFIKILREVTIIGSVRLALIAFKQALKKSYIRMNAIDVVIIPKLRKQIKGMEDELDEIDREAFFRIIRTKQRKAREKLKEESTKEPIKEEKFEIVTRNIFDQVLQDSKVFQLGPCDCQNTPICHCNERRVRKKRNFKPKDMASQTGS